MTIQQMIDSDPDALEAMTDAELFKHTEPYLKITRPELAQKPEKSGPRKISDPNFNAKFDAVAKMASQLGIDLSFDND